REVAGRGVRDPAGQRLLDRKISGFADADLPERTRTDGNTIPRAVGCGGMETLPDNSYGSSGFGYLGTAGVEGSQKRNSGLLDCVCDGGFSFMRWTVVGHITLNGR